MYISRGKKIIISIFIIIILIIIAVIGIYFYKNKNAQQQPVSEKKEQENIEKQIFGVRLSSETDPAKLMLEDFQSSRDKGLKDSDNDGISDEDELKTYYYSKKENRTLRLDPNNSDTDGDELKDGEEIFNYKTNPLNPDSDGDGYSDGEEVKAGYNPLGSGKL